MTYRPLTDKQRHALVAVRYGAAREGFKTVGRRCFRVFFAYHRDATHQIRSLLRRGLVRWHDWRIEITPAGIAELEQFYGHLDQCQQVHHPQ